MKELEAYSGASRLFTKRETARYLGYKTASIIDIVGIVPIRLNESGPGSSPRYDKNALDDYLNNLSGLCRSASIPNADDDAKRALQEWSMRHDAH